MTSEEETQLKESRTARFAQWLMDRESRRQEKESNLEGLIKLNFLVSVSTLIAVAGTSVANYVLMAWTWI